MRRAVEVKVNVEGAVADALAALRIDGGETIKRQIWFADDHDGVLRGDLPLLARGVIIRFRSGDEPDDLTVKLRPCDERNLVGRWQHGIEGEEFEYRIEGDWAGSRHSVAASAVGKHGQGALLAAVGQDAEPATVLSRDQREFVEQCVHPTVCLDRLIALGPIAATKWADRTIGNVEKVCIERWTVGDLDLLELSIRVKQKDEENAEDFESRVGQKQRQLQAAVRADGVQIADREENKTQLVMNTLAGLRLVDH
ncbi:hypothetical protein ACGFK1_18780 [Mycobacterium sp. NPDC048908]|uniref:hypothetical protein n=1 Tax=Mycobacterium sp. NPDC048908 TaxID=3364292 RepID=UPI00371BA072